jgi:IS4 transposase
VLVTTLLDHRQVSKDDLSALYARRWNVELDLRNLKTTCCGSVYLPAMVPD